jgi:lysophospholipase L1-like esterase
MTMHPLIKKIFSWSMMGAYVLVCGEISIRLLSAFFMVYTIEMLDYAKELKIKSDIPGISHQHRANAGADLMGVKVTLNSLGHRSDELKNPKPKNERRIHVLGSSITLGWGVPVDEGFVARLQHRLNAEKGSRNGLSYKTVNAGVGNYNAYYAVELFKRQVEATDPDVVVLQYYINDAELIPPGEDHAILKYSVLAAFIYQNVKTLMAVSTKTLDEHYRELYTDGATGWETAKASIRELKALAERRGTPLVVFLVPELHDLSEDGPYPPIYRMLGDAFTEMGIPMINPLPRFQAAFGKDPSRLWVDRHDPHPNSAAHKLLADVLFDYLAPRIE